ncbi:MAG: ATP-dependent metallopeptidase FtsH/Yme1/Tma family protein, partial [bacterium]
MPVSTPPKNGNNNSGFNWGRFSKTLSFWILIILIPVALIQLSGKSADAAADISYTQYKQELDRNNIAEVTMSAGKNVVGTFREPTVVAGKPAKKFTAQLPVANSQTALDQLDAKGVKVTSQDPKPSVMAWVINFLPWLLLIGFYLFLFRQMQAGGNKAFSFGKSKAKLLTGDTPKVTFADVAGADEAVEELHEIKEFLQEPAKFQAVGAKIPKGVLLYGPPGTGKT